MDLQNFHTLVSRMQSPNNEERSDAEKVYDDVALASKVSNLYTLYAAPGVSVEARTLCLVLLRRLLANNWDELAEALGAANQKALHDQMLQAAMDETDSSLRKKLAEVVAEVARNTIDDESGKQNWIEVLKFLEHCMNIDSAEHKLTAMLLIEAVPNIFGADQDHYLAGIKKLLESCLTHSSAPVRSAASKAFVGFISVNEDDDKLVKGFSGCIPAIIEICKHVVETEEDDDSPIQALSDLATCTPKILTPYITQIIEMCTAVIANVEKDESYRHSAMEVLTSICECAPNTIKKRASQHIPAMLESAVLLMTELNEDSTEWLAVDDLEEGDLDDEDSVGVGESSLDRIACSLNGKAILEPFQRIAQALLSDSDWRKRHAALMGLSTIGEGCKRAMEPVIDNVVSIIVPFLQDEHPRVRYAACNALGQMSTDFAPTLQKKSHAKVVPGLLQTVIDTSCPRVSAHAGAALVNFSEDCPQQVVTAYLPVMMERLEHVLETTFKVLQEKGKKIVLEQIITTIASVADASKELFITFYDRMMPPLKYILQHSEDAQFKLLRGKSIECISLIGLAVGKEKFGNDAVEIMNILSSTMPTLTPDDPQCSYMISGWTRICKVLGPDFAPFLPMVMDPVMRAASYNPEIAVVDDEEAEEDDPHWQFHSVGENKNFGIRTSGLEEKATACEMIVCYARDLKENFAPYVDKVAEMMVEHLKFLFHDGVRASAAETMPCLLDCVKHMGVDAMRRLWTGFLPALVTAADKHEEEDAEVLCEILNAISECIAVLGTAGIAAEDLQVIGKLLADQFTGYEKRKEEREAEEADEDEDPEEAKELLDDEMESEAAVMGRMSDIIHSGFENLGDIFYGLIEPLLPQIVKLIDPRRYYSDRQWGVCMLDDVLEFAPKRLAAHQAQFVPLMMRCLADEYPEVRQAAAYGFGIMAMKGGAEYLASVTAALEPLAAMISKADARSTEEGSVATENAIAAVAKILKYAGAGVDVTQVIPAFLSWLPTFEDEDESAHIYGYFCDLVEGNHPSMLGPDNSNLPKILNIVVTAFQMDAFSEEEDCVPVKLRMVNIVKMMQQSGMLENIAEVAELDEEKQSTLEKLLTQ